jgi:hypothetical protein
VTWNRATNSSKAVGENESASSGPMRMGDVLVSELGRAFEDEKARKETIEKRGLGVLTSASAFITTIFAIAAAISDKRDWPVAATVLLASGASMLLLSGTLGLYCSAAPRAYLRIDPRSMLKMAAPSEWGLEGDDAVRQFALARVHILRQWTAKNQSTAWVLTAAVCVELLGVCLSSSSLLSLVAHKV